MAAFFNSLSILEIILFTLATASSILLVIQIILMLIGFSGSDALDADGIPDGDDMDVSGGDGVALFTVKGFIAFFSIGGWTGLIISRAGAHIALVIVGAFLSGAVALVAVAFILKAASKLQSNGLLNYKNAVGLEARVYLTIPPKGKGSGKINVTFQERYIEAEAVSEDDEPIPTGSSVTIVSYKNESFVVKSKE